MIKTDNGDCWHNIMTFMKEMLKVGNRAVLVVISDLLYNLLGWEIGLSCIQQVIQSFYNCIT